jgi:hypothetical protein
MITLVSTQQEASFILSVSPCPYLFENADSSIREADGVMLFLRRVEGRLGSIRQFIQPPFLFGNVQPLLLEASKYKHRHEG